ncbi:MULTISPECIES: hypothetical protein [unclassified Paenibacillus]|uniref:hypothetical protein n=1 Tax=Paenibacillus TaxID=44249 RepID=UPI0003903074|nr:MULTISPECIES: hypothetical protein [unclassified Paenibacillus]KKC47973.1 hypothetical protein VE23_14030 [Paenibacillus sp. D9]CDN45617.1 hypothetical protein BN871_IH_00020 [Paenibacillus sp. P22]
MEQAGETKLEKVHDIAEKGPEVQENAWQWMTCKKGQVHLTAHEVQSSAWQCMQDEKAVPKAEVRPRNSFFGFMPI